MRVFSIAGLWTFVALVAFTPACHALYPFLPSDAGPTGGDLGVDAGTIGDLAAADAGADASANWRLVKHLDPALGCPAPWVLIAGTAGCGMASKPSCRGNSVAITVQPAGPYSEVRGFVRGLQWKSTDAFAANKGGSTIDGTYVDGVSFTVGKPRKHLWTFASALYLTAPGANSCPCNQGTKPPTFVGPNYTCDSGNPSNQHDSKWYTSRQLWGVGSTGADCKPLAAPGWFEARVAPTVAPIEVRV